MAAKPLRETVEELAAGLVYAEEPGGSGLIVVNKPYGLPVNTAEDSPVSLTACLPGLAERLGAGDKNNNFLYAAGLHKIKFLHYLGICFVHIPVPFDMVSVWKTSKKDSGKAGKIIKKPNFFESGFVWTLTSRIWIRIL